MRRRLAGLALVSLVSWSCASASKSLPGWGESDPAAGSEAGTEMRANDPAAVVSTKDDAAAGESAPGEPDAADPVAAAEPTEAAPTEPPAGGAAEPAQPVEPAAPEKEPLPKPMHAKVDGTCGKGPGVGQRLKSFSLKTTKGKAVSSGSLKGKVAVVNFWGTWCKPCLKELPEFDQLHRRYRKHGMTLLAIATDTDPAPVDEFVGKHHLSAKVLIGGEDYANGFSPDKFPFTFVVDGKGIIRASYSGYRPECLGKLEADVRKQLEER